MGHHSSHKKLITLESLTDNKGKVTHAMRGERLIRNDDNKSIIDSLNSTNKMLADIIKRLNKLEQK